MRRRAMIAAMSLAVATGWAAVAAADPVAPALHVASPFVTLGTSASFTVTGEPAASYVLYLATQPAEVPLGALGTLFLKSGTFVPIAGGNLNETGSANAQLPIPNAPQFNGLVLYAQALVTAGGVSHLSNATPFRGQAQPPAGGRAPRALALTPDGAKAYTANQLDGTVSAIDLVGEIKRADLPVAAPAPSVPYRPVDIAVDPDGRHAFAVNAASGVLTVIDVATDSIAAQIPIAKGSRRIAFNFGGGNRRIYITNEITNTILVFTETTPGVFAAQPGIPLQGAGPGPIALLVDGRLLVGHRATLDLELVDPTAAPGSTTVARIALGMQPLDVVIAGTEALVPTFKPAFTATMNGFNILVRVNLGTLQATGSLFSNAGTDYTAAAVSGSLIAVAAAGSGVAVVGDLGAGALLEAVNLVPGGTDPHGTPQAIAFGPPAGAPAKLYTVDQFRETLRVITLSGGPPFAVGTEIALAYSGAPRVPLSGDLSPFEDGDYLMRSVHFFNGTAQNPNSATCQTCHTDGASDNITRPSGRQPQSLYNLADTAPYNWQGNSSDLLAIIRGAFNFHGKIGGPIMGDADLKLLAFFQAFGPPPSIYPLNAAAQAGKTLFEGGGLCTGCHAAPSFIPPAGQPLTIAAGVGTGLAPINVPSLRALWVSAPYLHDGSARRLGQVFTAKPGDIHNQLMAGFTPAQVQQLVAYLLTL